ncbi:uncharacterized protein LOC18428771 isoform X2 [Amborella trichopoda]|uniref:Uncharacterized protein n=1 Tax=Amborella trichopoda TaxID=13333 RepID=W1NTE7_AMBTC|nr:uncharacterized protein LOC18428771 isoform X2 [Amborella trichopoda]ERN00702.1 hypothetical protein AMTR_s00106p00078380 [Amborella trichopoda]|eukprot:XP_006838133.1 uncharacterized protein LOC18428771 isoform X2 [Amborella trichopoda]
MPPGSKKRAKEKAKKRKEMGEVHPPTNIQPSVKVGDASLRRASLAEEESAKSPVHKGMEHSEEEEANHSELEEEVNGDGKRDIVISEEKEGINGEEKKSGSSVLEKEDETKIEHVDFLPEVEVKDLTSGDFTESSVIEPVSKDGGIKEEKDEVGPKSSTQHVDFLQESGVNTPISDDSSKLPVTETEGSIAVPIEQSNELGLNSFTPFIKRVDDFLQDVGVNSSISDKSSELGLNAFTPFIQRVDNFLQEGGVNSSISDGISKLSFTEPESDSKEKNESGLGSSIPLIESVHSFPETEVKSLILDELSKLSVTEQESTTKEEKEELGLNSSPVLIEHVELLQESECSSSISDALSKLPVAEAENETKGENDELGLNPVASSVDKSESSGKEKNENTSPIDRSKDEENTPTKEIRVENVSTRSLVRESCSEVVSLPVSCIQDQPITLPTFPYPVPELERSKDIAKPESSDSKPVSVWPLQARPRSLWSCCGLLDVFFRGSRD